MTAEHLKPILDNARDGELFCQFAELMARASIPEEVLKANRMGRMTAFQKPSGVCEESWQVTSFGGWCRGPLHSRPERRWRRPLHPSNMLCPPALGVSALFTRSRQGQTQIHSAHICLWMGLVHTTPSHAEQC